MPALIIFGATPDSAEGGKKAKRSGDQLKVSETAQVVVKKLGDAESGFAAFSPQNKPDAKIWINRYQVRMVRAA